MFYGEEQYSSREEAEKQSGVKLLCYGNINTDNKTVYARDPRWASAVFASNSLEDDEEEVIMLDLDEAGGGPVGTALGKDGKECLDENWWAVVPNLNPPRSPIPKLDGKTREKVEPALHLETPQGTAVDGFQLVDDEEMVNAISDFSAQCVRRFKGAKALDPTQMQTLLQSAFAQVEPKGTVGRIWQWGSLAYTGYGWASYGYYLYRQPVLMRGAYSICKWLLVLII